jgi:hypothetical protein
MPLPVGLQNSHRNGGRVFSFSWRILQPDDEWIVELILSMFKLAGCLLWLLLWIAILWS